MHCSIIDNGSIKSNHATNVALIINLNNNTMHYWAVASIEKAQRSHDIDIIILMT